MPLLNKFSIRLSDEQLAKLNELATFFWKTKTSIIKDALTIYMINLDENKTDIEESLKRINTPVKLLSTEEFYKKFSLTEEEINDVEDKS